VAVSAALVLGRYAIFDRIAAGGMATVHFGRLEGAAGFTRTVAIKRLHPHLAEDTEFVSMMIDEARLAGRVQHPNVVQTLDVVSLDGELLVVMEYVQGESLARLMRVESAGQRRAPLPIVSAVMIGVLHGLHAAHEAKSDKGVPLGIVHRDVSPQNILVGVDGVARVLDFGVAKAVGRLQTTREGVIKGKLAYMAPEQLSGLATTRAADIYAVGVVLWEALTGRRLFMADGDAELLGKVLSGCPDRPSLYTAELPEAVDALVMRALSRDPAARFATAREMAGALGRAVPPALTTDVGAWVEQTASEVIAKRAAQLAEIESRSSVSVRPPGRRETLDQVAVAKGEGPVERPQADGSIVTSTSSVAGTPPRLPRARAGIVVGAAVAVVAIVAGVWRAGRESPATQAATAAQSASATAPAVASGAASTLAAAEPPSAPAPVASVEGAVPSASATAPPARPIPLGPGAGPVSKPPRPQKPAVRFHQPD